MPKVLTVLFLMFPAVLYAGENPFFGDKENQMFVGIGAGVDHGFIIPTPTRWIPFGLANVQYGQPNTFFRLPGRIGFGLNGVIGFGDKYGWNWSDCSAPIASLSQDVALLEFGSFYAGTGLGAGMQARQNSRESSKLLIQFKLFFGYRLAKNTRLEFFTQHFSNGDTTPDNHAYNFFGLGLGYNF